MIYKKAKREDLENYQKLQSNLSTWKNIEKSFLDTIKGYLKNKDVIRHTQHGFTVRKVCLSNVTSFYNHITRSVDRGKAEVEILLDFIKAFDTVPHRILLNKLSNHDLHRSSMADEVAEWQSSKSCSDVWQHLAGSHVQCSPGFNSKVSVVQHIYQWSRSGVECILGKFGDNTKLGGAADSLEGQEALWRDLSRLDNWAIVNCIKFSMDKCWFLHLGWRNAKQVQIGRWIAENHRIVGSGRDLQRSSSPAPLQSRPPMAGCMGRFPSRSWISPEKENPQPPWAACSSALLPHYEEVPSHIGAELPVLQFMAVSPCLVPTDRWKEVGHVLLTPTLKRLININKITLIS